MTVSTEAVLERAMERAFLRALEQTVQAKAEALFTKALSSESPLAKKLEEKIEQGFQLFLEEGIRWEKNKPGFRN
jgi:flagellar biosynthesis/type III secretory pathway protein FliH